MFLQEYIARILRAFSVLSLTAFLAFYSQISLAALPNGGAVSGSISSVGDVDTYTFSANAGESVVLSLVDPIDTTFYPKVEVYLPDGTTLLKADADPDVALVEIENLPETGTYSVLVRNGSGSYTGDYNLYFVRAPGANEGGALAGNEDISASLALGDLDTHTFTASAGNSVQLSLGDTNDTDFYPDITVFGPDGSIVGSDSDPDVAVVQLDNLSVGGTYTVLLRNFEGTSYDAGGNYFFSFIRAPDLAEGGVLPDNADIGGSIELGDIDSYSFELLAGNSAQLSLADVNNTDFYPDITVYDPDGNLLSGDSDQQVAFVELQNVVKSGSYTVVLRNFEGTSYDAGGSYHFSFVKAPGTSEGGVLAANEDISGSVALGDIDSYTFNASAGNSVELSLGDIDSTDFYPDITVYDPDGNSVGRDADTLVAFVRLENLEKSGTYTVVLRNFEGTSYDSGGNYHFSFVKAPGAAEGGLLPGNADILGSFELGDIDSYAFEAVAGNSVQLSLGDIEDTDFFPYIAVYDPDGTLIGIDSDSRIAAIQIYGLNKSGTYTVVLRNFEGTTYDAGGNYRFSFALAPGANEQGMLSDYAEVSETLTYGDLDSYTFSANVGESIKLSVSDPVGGDFVPNIYVYSPTGALLGSGSDSDGDVAAVTASNLAETGVYTIIVRNSNKTILQASAYDLYFAKAPGAREASINHLGDVSEYIDLGDIDAYVLYLEQGDDLQLAVADTSPNGDISLEVSLYEPSGHYLQRITVGSSGVLSRPNMPASGWYSVFVRDYSENPDSFGSYTLATTVNDGPPLPDTDGDDVLDRDDNCINDINADQADNDADGLGDACDPDDDNDGLPDVYELAEGLNPFDPADAQLDTDGDGLTELQEYQMGTDADKADTDDDGINDAQDPAPLNPDRDGDGVLDGADNCPDTANPSQLDHDSDGVGSACDPDDDNDDLTDTEETDTYGTDPENADTDGDSLSDSEELYEHSTNPLEADSDGDGLSDGDEVNSYGTDPLEADSDNDGLSDSEEVNNHGTDPLQADSDGDGLKDGYELEEGLNPLDSTDCPAWLCESSTPVWMYTLPRD